MFLFVLVLLGLSFAPLALLLSVGWESVHRASTAPSAQPAAPVAHSLLQAQASEGSAQLAGSSSVAPRASAHTASEVASSANAHAHTQALDGTLDRALRSAGADRFLMLTFGNAKVLDHLLNFCHHARRAGIVHVVGAVDVDAFTKLASHGEIATYKTPLAFERYTLDGGNSHSSSSWKRFAAMRTGEVARVVQLGYDVLHSDTDIIWLRDPTPYLMCAGAAARVGGEFGSESRFPCAPLRSADVAVSSDNMGPSRAVAGRAAYHASGTFNSGILLFRATPDGKRFVKAWHQNVAEPARGSRFARLTSDQQVFNNMVRKERQWPGVGGRRDSWLMHSIHPDWQGNLTLGALPLPLFANGHGYFVQSAHTALNVAPFAVHATYTLDYHDGTAKRQRFREAGLWAAESPPSREERYLALNVSVPPDVLSAINIFQARGGNPHNIGVHAIALASYVGELRDALALARAMGRTLILPRRQCYCDKLWAGSDNILRTGCMYPGSQDAPFLPVTCPMDHLLSPHDWGRSAVAYRDHAFLEKLLAERPPRGRTVRDIRIVPPKEYKALHSRSDSALPQGTLTAAEAAQRLQKRGGAQPVADVLRLQHARNLLCGVGSKRETRDFNALSRAMLRVPPWCTRCDRCQKHLEEFMGPVRDLQRGRSKGRMRGPEWCLNTYTPPAFEFGQCVLNDA